MKNVKRKNLTDKQMDQICEKYLRKDPVRLCAGCPLRDNLYERCYMALKLRLDELGEEKIKL